MPYTYTRKDHSEEENDVVDTNALSNEDTNHHHRTTSGDVELSTRVTSTQSTSLMERYEIGEVMNEENDERNSGLLLNDEISSTTNKNDNDGNDSPIQERDYNQYTRWEKFKHLLVNMRAQFKNMLEIAFPTILMNISNKILGLEDMAFIGRLGSEDYMASAALANAIFFCLSFISVGLINGQDTFVAQAFGAKNKPLVGVWMMRSVALLVTFLIPVFVVLFFLEFFLITIGVEEKIAHLSGQFVRYLLPGLLPFALNRSVARFLVSVDVRLPNTIIPITAIFVNFGLNWLFVFGIGYKGIGFLGAAIATSLSRIFSLLCYIYVLYHHREKFKECVYGARQWKEVFQISGFIEYLKQAVPGTIATCCEVWAFEMTTLIAAYMSPTHVAAHSIVLNVTSLSFMVPLALSSAAAVMVGQRLGARNPQGAKYSAYLCLTSSGLFMVFNAIAIGALSTLIPRIYTNEQPVIDMAASIFPLVSLFAVTDGVQGTASGVLRGASCQMVSMVANIIAYYVISIPIGMVLAFVVDWQLLGLWTGLTISLVLVAGSLLLYIIFKINWEKESQVAYERASKMVKSNSTSSSLDSVNNEEKSNENDQ